MTLRFAAIAFASSLAIPGLASAQTPAFADLASRLDTGDKVIVLDRSGKTAAGRLERLTADGITVRSDTNTIVVPANDVQRVAVPRHGKRNGFLIGAALGLVTGLTVTGLEADDAGGKSAIVATSTLLYGAIGLGLGALWPAERVIYRAPIPGPPSAPQTMSRVDGRRLGVSFAVRW